MGLVLANRLTIANPSPSELRQVRQSLGLVLRLGQLIFLPASGDMTCRKALRVVGWLLTAPIIPRPAMLELPLVSLVTTLGTAVA